MLTEFFNVYVRVFFILTPFFVTSVFLVMTRGQAESDKRRLAMKVTIAVLIISLSMHLFGRYIFAVFGVTLDAFRIGAGTLLFLSALSLVQGSPAKAAGTDTEDIAVVPLALPITVGPGTIGMLLVMGAEDMELAARITTVSGISAAAVTVGLLLAVSGGVERLLGVKGLLIMSKLTGIFVASIAAQLVFTGVVNFLATGGA